MSTYYVTTSNWNDPLFWSGITETGPGHTLDFSALPSTYSVDFIDNNKLLTISDGTSSYTIGDTTNGNEPEDAELGGTTSWDYFSTFRGSEGSDDLEGSNDDETFYLGGGDDTLNDSGGNATVYGGDGNDTITTSSGADTVDGGAGNDTISTATGNDTIDGGDGDDYILAGGADDTVHGGSGNDTIHGGAASDLLFGGDGADTIFGEDADDTLVGGGGDDTLDGGAGRNTFVFRTGSGNDTINNFNTGKDTIDLSFAGVNSFADVQPLMSQDAADTVIAFADGSSLRFTSINSADLAASNFTYYAGPVCYAPGTLIDTPDGPRAVESLRPGDLVTTLDHGAQIVRWVHSGDCPLEEVEVDAKPVLIAAGALGGGGQRKT